MTSRMICRSVMVDLWITLSILENTRLVDSRIQRFITTVPGVRKKYQGRCFMPKVSAQKHLHVSVGASNGLASITVAIDTGIELVHHITGTTSMLVNMHKHDRCKGYLLWSSSVRATLVCASNSGAGVVCAASGQTTSRSVCVRGACKTAGCAMSSSSSMSGATESSSCARMCSTTIQVRAEQTLLAWTELDCKQIATYSTLGSTLFAMLLSWGP